ncbi:DUF6516 family protein [uncultured Lamprocystis sp.]|jgi:hypothetical protein|uniref:toxin-antitoxin system TumE family protein n=1 Tax=uncultured Lamprocystis sp. TaxID=543132 RepID=UPI0025D7D9D1|nr:DUF6516 family protein [uncultured Lamprocystis sp.]
MNATLRIRAKEVDDEGSLIAVVVWDLPEPLPPCTHLYKYRLFYGTATEERVRYDNERGKGDHRHFRGNEESYSFSTIEQLLADFRQDIQAWRRL